MGAAAIAAAAAPANRKGVNFIIFAFLKMGYHGRGANNHEALLSKPLCEPWWEHPHQLDQRSPWPPWNGSPAGLALHRIDHRLDPGRVVHHQKRRTRLRRHLGFDVSRFQRGHLDRTTE